MHNQYYADYNKAIESFDAATRLNPAEETVRQATQPAPTQPAPQPE
jgi:hypothetical protein